MKSHRRQLGYHLRTEMVYQLSEQLRTGLWNKLYSNLSDQLRGPLKFYEAP